MIQFDNIMLQIILKTMQVKQNWTPEQIMSEYTDLEDHYVDQVEACINIGLQCVEIDQHKRPTIQKIVNMINKISTN